MTIKVLKSFEILENCVVFRLTHASANFNGFQFKNSRLQVSTALNLTYVYFEDQVECDIDSVNIIWVFSLNRRHSHSIFCSERIVNS